MSIDRLPCGCLNSCQGHCALCRDVSVGDFEFETGNGANYAVDIPLCETHAFEAEDTGYAFEVKYADQILEQLYEHWRGMADARED